MTDRETGSAVRGVPPIRHDIICMSTNHWTGLPTSKQSLMLEMARSVRVLYVEPPLDIFSVVGRRRRWPKLRGLRQVHPNLWVLSPVAFSVSSRPAVRTRSTERLLPRVAAAAERLGLGDRVLWCFAPEHAVLAGRLGECALVYSAADEPAAFSTAPDATRETERRMLGVADLVLVVSEALLDARSDHPNAHRLPNAADVPHFKRALAGDAEAGDAEFIAALGGTPAPMDLVNVRRPVIMYGGAAYGWFDFDLLREVADLRPGWMIVLVGPGGTGERLPANVVRLGRRPYDEFPRYVASCDVAIIPWRDGLFARNADPIVLYQYLLCGKPVVATPFPAALERGGLVATARDPMEFVNAVERALSDRDHLAHSAERTAFGLANTWQDRAARAALLIESAVSMRTGSPGREAQGDAAPSESGESV